MCSYTLREEYFSFILVQLNCFIISLISQKESLDDLSLNNKFGFSELDLRQPAQNTCCILLKWFIPT